jgi:hypothetical protein
LISRSIAPVGWALEKRRGRSVLRDTELGVTGGVAAAAAVTFVSVIAPPHQQS